MFIQLLVSVCFLFFLLLGLLLFFIRHQSRVPYYRLSQDQCINLLNRAIQGALPEHEWHAFIGMTVRDDGEMDELREKCLLIDEFGIKGTHSVNNQPCILFNNQGVEALTVLLDEWRHKSKYVV